MSDININTSWTSVTDSYKAYQNTLTLYALDSNSNILCGVQQTPPTAGYTTTDGLSTYLQGTTLNKGYDGKWIKTDLVSNTDTNMTTFVYYMRNKLNDYDISNTRCYIQFKNNYRFPISSWELLTDDNTILVSGDSIASAETLEINFINDYDTVNFKLKITLSGTPSSVGHWLYIPYGDSTLPLEPTAYNYGASDGLYHIHCDIPNGVFITCHGATGGTTDFYIATLETSAPSNVETTFIRIGYHTYWSANSWNGFIGNYSATSSSGYIYRSTSYNNASQLGQFLRNCLTYNGYYGYTSVSDAISDLYDFSFGVSTTTLNNYVGSLLECKMFADISQTFPGPSNDVDGGTLATFDDTTDINSVPNVPTVDMATINADGKSTGAFSIFKLTLDQYEYVRKCLFSTDIVTNLKNYFTRPIDGIIALGRFPFVPTSRTQETPIYIGNVGLTYDNALALGSAIDRYHSFNCGSVEILPYWDTALDYDPYTRIMINLPFIGRRQLNTDLIMGKTITLVYHIDIITGGCVAFILANNDLIEQYSGNMMTVAPLSGEDFSRVYGALLSATASSVVSGTLSGSPMSAITGAVTGSANSLLHSKRDFAGNVNFGGSTSMLENLQPYIEIIRPVQSKPRDYASFKGYVSTVTELLGNCEGYTEVLDVHLENMNATDTEKDEIMSLLKSGVII